MTMTERSTTCGLKNTSRWMLLMRQHSKKLLVEVNPPQSCPQKQNGTTVIVAMIILKVVNNWRSVLQIIIMKKSPSVSENVCYYYNTSVMGIYMVYMVGRRGKTPQIESLFESNFRPCGHSSSDLQNFPFFSGPKVQRQLTTRVSWVL